MSAVQKREIPDNALTVLSAGHCEGTRFYLPDQQLDRKLYEAVNKVLDALGGKWSRSAKAHIFPEDCADLIDSAIESGSYTRPDDMGWFPTPAALAARICDMAQIEPGMLVLEPSAGEGAIAFEAADRGGDVRAIEIDPKRAAKLLSKLEPAFVSTADFMDFEPSPTFDRIVMNPPFAKRADIHHVLHARRFLKPGGKLVAIMSASAEFREDALAREFRQVVDTMERLPDESFKESGTGVRTVVVTISAAAAGVSP